MPLLDVVLGYDCNLACNYCTITTEMRKRALPKERVALEIDRAAGRGFRDIAFTGGEPTIFPELPLLVKYAKRRGFEHVKVASNGLRYAHEPYLDHLISCGVDQFHVSAHAFSEEEYERTVHLSGTAHLKRKALENLVHRNTDPVVDLIVKEDTYRTLPAWINSLVQSGIRRFALWLVSLTDNNVNNVAQLPRITDIVPYLIASFEAAQKGGYEVVSLHVPRCFLPGYEAHVKHPGANLVTVVTPDDVFDLQDSRLGGGFKPGGCEGCLFADTCPGLRHDYVEQFGGAEVKAILPPLSIPDSPTS